MAVALFLLPLAHAQETATESGIPQRVDYTMPYPGLLPDNPLYPFKMLRDRIAIFLTKDPQKQAELSLLLAEKRVSGGYYLFLKSTKQEERALSTIGKGQSYFAGALQATKEASRQGMDVKYLIEKMHTSLQKQQELFDEMKQRLPTNEQAKMGKIEERRRDLEKAVKEFASKTAQKK